MLPSGVFYDSMARAALDFGCELNNYHGLFASYQAECGDLDYYVLLGPRVRSVTARSSVAERRDSGVRVMSYRREAVNTRPAFRG